MEEEAVIDLVSSSDEERIGDEEGSTRATSAPVESHRYVRRRSPRKGKMTRRKPTTNATADEENDLKHSPSQPVGYCIVCTSEYPAVGHFSNRTKKLSEEDDIFFLLEKCLGVSSRDLQRAKVKIGDGFNGGIILLCPVHQQTLMEARQLHTKITKLQKDLKKLKRRLKVSVVKSGQSGDRWKNGRMWKDSNVKVLRDTVLKCINGNECTGNKNSHDTHASQHEWDHNSVDGLNQELILKQETEEELIDEMKVEPSSPMSESQEDEVSTFDTLGFSDLVLPKEEVDDCGIEPWEDVLNPDSSPIDKSPRDSNDNEDPDHVPSETKNSENAVTTRAGRKIAEGKMKYLPEANSRKRTLKTIKRAKVSRAVKKPRIRKNLVGTRKCRLCPKRFATAEERDRHQAASHGEDQKFQCLICGEMLSTEHGLKNHELNVHATEKPFACDLCDKKFAYQYLLRGHRKNHTRNKDFTPCPHCNKEYKGPERLRAHIIQKHEKTLSCKTFMCEYCSKTYVDPAALKTHQAKDHLNTYQRVKCEVCGKELSDIRSLRKHRQSQHLNAYKFQCEKCGTKCLFKSHLAAHMKSAHNDSGSASTKVKKTVKPKQGSDRLLSEKSKYNHECDSCGQEFDNRSEVMKHRRSCTQFAYL